MIHGMVAVMVWASSVWMAYRIGAYLAWREADRLLTSTLNAVKRP